MTPYQLNLLREWVQAEIAYAIASNEEDSSGYRFSAIGERRAAQQAFEELKEVLCK